MTEIPGPRRGERYFRALVEHATEVITVLGPDGTILYSNPALKRLIGVAPGKQGDKSIFELVHPEDADKARDAFTRIRKTPDQAIEVFLRVRNRRGSWRHVDLRVRNLLADAAVEGIVVSWHDITEELLAEERLKAREHFFRSIIERSTDILVVVDADREVRYVSPAFESILGISMDQLIGTSGMHLLHTDDLPAAKELADTLFVRGESTAGAVLRARHANGEYRIFDVRIRNMLDDPVFRGLVIDARDITDRQRIEVALRASEERFRKIVETSGEGIGIRDPDGRLTFVNRRLAGMLGRDPDEMIGLSIFEIVAPEYRAPMFESGERRRVSGRAEQMDIEFLRKDGTRMLAILSASPLYDADGTYIGSLGMVTDITDRKRLEEQLGKSQKIEAVGRLAGGIAHDFNNLLTAIRGHVELLLGDLSADDPRHSDVVEIRKAADRAAGLTHQLLAFSRQQLLQPRVIELDSVVADIDAMLRRLIGEDIQLVTRLGAGGACILADRSQIEQVLMNLAVNARDAMPDGGTLEIVTDLFDVDRDFTHSHPGSQTGPHVRLRVCDNGDGMSADTLSHLFEPFFTTKELGKGTGLGLATIYGIVKQSGGYIGVESVEAEGTSFEILLPIVTEAPFVQRVAAPVEPAAVRGETILVTEDEDSVRSLIVRILRKHGYTVLEARNGSEALDVARQLTGPIDLLLTDVVMPVLGGRELSEQLTQIRPATKIVFMSGYTDDALLARGVSQGGNFLEKPFTPDSLTAKVRAALDS